MDFRQRESTRTDIYLWYFGNKTQVRNRAKQYKSKLKDWGFEKNFKEKDMRAIVRKDLKRKAEDPFKATVFRLRKRLVPLDKIERYRKEHGITERTIMSDASKPANSLSKQDIT